MMGGFRNAFTACGVPHGAARAMFGSCGFLSAFIARFFPHKTSSAYRLYIKPVFQYIGVDSVKQKIGKKHHKEAYKSLLDHILCLFYGVQTTAGGYELHRR